MKRASRKKKKTLAAVPVLPTPPANYQTSSNFDAASIDSTTPHPAEPGRVEKGVIAEIEGLTTAGKRPGLVEGALAMARLLDSPLNVPQHPQAMARLQAVLAELRIGADSRKGWLMDVRRMTPASGAAG